MLKYIFIKQKSHGAYRQVIKPVNKQQCGDIIQTHSWD